MFDERESLRADLEQEHRNEEFMREYNNRSFEITQGDMDYIDPYYGDLREDPMGY